MSNNWTREDDAGGLLGVAMILLSICSVAIQTNTHIKIIKTKRNLLKLNIVKILSQTNFIRQHIHT